MRLLCTGDVHLGRNPTRIPPDRVPDQRPFSTRAIWERIVALAIEERVDALLISGDLVDHDNRFFEAIGPIESGVQRLAAAGIPVFAVAGNHDYDVLPALADRLENKLRLLGRHQRWERHTWRDADGRALLHIDGWSFGNEHVELDPIAAYALPAVSDAPVVGLLHTDLDQRGSRYAPTSTSSLYNQPVAAWLIGHIHAPALKSRAGAPPVLYPGSPAPLDPGEPGAHGVWFLDLEPNRPAEFSFRPLSPLRYEPIEVDLTGAANERDASTRVYDQIEGRLHTLERSGEAPANGYLLCRIHLTGRTALPRGFQAEIKQSLDQTMGRWSIESLIDRTRPVVSLDDLSLESSPAGALARLILQIGDDESSSATIARAETVIEAECAAGHFRPLDETAPPDARAMLEDVAWDLLERVLETRATTV